MNPFKHHHQNPSPGSPSDPSAPQYPKQIVIIRHGEKPGDPTDDGDKDPNLSPQGYERAAALARYVPSSPLRPDFLFATALSAHSNRPVETITPLSQVMGLEINQQYADGDYARLASAILTGDQYKGKPLFICWHHGKIPQLAMSIGAQDVPMKWNPDVFDRFWVLTFTDRGAVQWQDLPQHLLPGDSAT